MSFTTSFRIGRKVQSDLKLDSLPGVEVFLKFQATFKRAIYFE